MVCGRKRKMTIAHLRKDIKMYVQVIARAKKEIAEDKQLIRNLKRKS